MKIIQEVSGFIVQTSTAKVNENLDKIFGTKETDIKHKVRMYIFDELLNHYVKP